MQNMSDDVTEHDRHEYDRESLSQDQDLKRLTQLRNQALLLEDGMEAEAKGSQDDEFYRGLDQFTDQYHTRMAKMQDQYIAYQQHLEVKIRHDAMVDVNWSKPR